MEGNADLRAATTVIRESSTRFRLDVPASMGQGRGTFGGLVFAAFARAFEESEPERERLLRTISAEIPVAVAPGPVSIDVEVARRGSAMSTLRGVMRQNDEIVAIATGVLGRARRDASGKPTSRDAELKRPSPAIPDWTAIPPSPMRREQAPVFTHEFEIRSTGPLPFSSSPSAIAEGFVRPRRCSGPLGAPEVVALADVFWPAAFAIEPGPRPIGTVSFFLQLFGDGTPRPSDAPLFYRARALGSTDGFVAEERELWSLDGDLVAYNTQTFVWIK